MSPLVKWMLVLIAIFVVAYMLNINLVDLFNHIIVGIQKMHVQNGGS